MENLTRSRRKPEKLKPIARKRHNYLYLLFAIVFAITTAYIFINFPPSFKISFKIFTISILPLFFISLAGFIFSILTFIFIQKTQGALITAFITIYLLIRTIGLTHWIFLALLAALFITIELFIYKKK